MKSGHLLPADAGICSNDPDAQDRAGGELLVDQPIFDESGKLTPQGEKIAHENGWDVVGPPWKRGITGHLEE